MLTRIISRHNGDVQCLIAIVRKPLDVKRLSVPKLSKRPRQECRFGCLQGMQHDQRNCSPPGPHRTLWNTYLFMFIFKFKNPNAEC